MQQLAFGIDFGTTNSLVCAWGSSLEGEPRPVAFWDVGQQGNRPHPSIVWYNAVNPVPKVGRAARDNIEGQSATMGHVFVSSVKRQLGGEKEIELVGGQRQPAWEVASEIFRHLREHAQLHRILRETSHELRDCVVTVPVDFGGRQRSDIRRALHKAGLRLKTFLHEPFAAMVSHFYDPMTKLRSLAGKRAIVFDWGGGTLDVCIAEVSEDGRRVYEVSHDGIADRAGDEFDKRVMHVTQRSFIERSGLNLEDLPIKGNALDRFRLAAEGGKIALSSKSETRIDVPSIFEAFGKIHDLEENVQREDFEAVARPEIEASEACVMRCLSKAKLTAGLIDHVLLVGGTSNIPAVRSMMEKIFGARVTVTHEPDAAIARGAAIVAAEGWEPYNVKDVGVVLSDDTLFTILPANKPLVASASTKHSFYCVDPRDGVARIQIAERSRAGDKALTMLGDCLSIETDPAVRKTKNLDRISAQFVITEDTTLRVIGQSAATGKIAETEIHDLCFGLRIE